LEEISPDGYSRYVSEGMLRASYRKLSAPPFENMNLPYHRSYKQDIAPLSKNEPAELIFDLYPISNLFNAGHRLRLSIACADQENFFTPELDPEPEVNLHRNRRYVSRIKLPVLGNAQLWEEKEGILAGVTFMTFAVIIISAGLLTAGIIWFLRKRFFS
jgi:predicted acyl esterase